MAFKLLDENDDDYISTDELMKRFTYCDIDEMTEQNVDEEFWKRLIADCDTNHDGYISWEEFRKNMNRLLTLQTEVTAYRQLDLSPKSDEVGEAVESTSPVQAT